MHSDENGEELILRSRGRAGGVVLLALLFSCASPVPDREEVSVTDAQYRISRLHAGEAKEEKPFMANFYRKGISPVLGTDCRWLPSDSEYALLKVRQCGVLRSAVKSFARYLSEFDAYQVADGAVNLHERMHFTHFDPSCDLF